MDGSIVFSTIYPEYCLEFNSDRELKNCRNRIKTMIKNREKPFSEKIIRIEPQVYPNILIGFSQTQTYELQNFDKVNEDYISSRLEKFSIDLKSFATRKRCTACGMKHMNISQISYRDADPSYFRFMRVDTDEFTELHLSAYTTIMDPVLENCILYPPTVNVQEGILNMCGRCDGHFNSSSLIYPSWILANHLTLLPLPDDLKDIKDPEIQLVTPVLRTHNIATISSGSIDKNTILRSHVYTYGANPTFAMATLPFDILSSKAFNVSIVGAYTSDIKALVSNVYEIRPEKSLRLLALCQERKNASVMAKTCHSLMQDIMSLAKSMFSFLTLHIEFNSNFADVTTEGETDLSCESHANMQNPHLKSRGENIN